MHTLKLGTRKSLLAWAQSSWVAREIERLNPGVKVELEGIETRGDRIQNVSLQQVAGKEFFVAELDEALHSGRVDLTVHSMKDLSLERPREFVCAAVPRRENPRDVVLFGPGVMEKLAAGKKLRIGTSSPRRIENIPPFLQKALPQVAGRLPSVELVEIRGNVNTRFSRVHEPESSERHLDAVVLAFAGLIRLWNDTQGRAELSKLLQGVRWMVLPLRDCPAAPAQGALAVECRASDTRSREIIGKLHNAESAATSGRERGLLEEWGGGCHQRFGATALEIAGGLMFVRGVKPDGDFVDESRWNPPGALSSVSSLSEDQIWDGSHWRAEAEKADEDLSWDSALEDRCVFVSHSRAVRQEMSSALSRSRVWTSGTPSWFRLAAQGIWVEGCSEGLGHEFVQPTLTEAVLQLAPLSEWVILTHEKAVKDWNEGQAIATYRVSTRYPDEAVSALKRSKQVYWSSSSQFDELNRFLNSDAQQACGPGKTAARLGSRAQVFPSVEEWRKWIQNTVNSR